MFGAFLMEGGVRGEDKEVVHVDNKPPFSDHIMKRVIHELLEGSGRVGEAEEHNCGFKQPLVGDKAAFH